LAWRYKSQKIGGDVERALRQESERLDVEPRREYTSVFLLQAQ
jgi:hypothetical protein